VLGKPSSAGMVATVAAWRECDDWLAACVRHLDGNRRFALQQLAERLPMVGCVEPEGTYLAWLDFSAVPKLAGGSAGERLRIEGRVALNEGPTFGRGLDAFARLNFATSRLILSRVLDRIEGWVNA
jgi:cystathionine beta-lyase